MKMLTKILTLILTCTVVSIALAEHPLDLVAYKIRMDNISSNEVVRICDLTDFHVGQPHTSNSFAGAIAFPTVTDTNIIWTTFLWTRVQFSNNGRSPDEPWLSMIQGTNNTADQFEIKVFPYPGGYTNMISTWDFLESNTSVTNQP